jgi:hypothetical protein
MVQSLWVGDIPSRTLDLSGGNFGLSALRRILPVSIKSSPRKSFNDEEDGVDFDVDLSNDPEDWEQAAGSSSDGGWSDVDDEFTVPDRLDEPPKTLNVSFCNALDPMPFARLVADQIPLLSNLNIAGTFRGQFSGAAFVSLVRSLINLRNLDTSASVWLKQDVAEEAVGSMVTQRLESFKFQLCPITDPGRLQVIIRSRYPECKIAA